MAEKKLYKLAALDMDGTLLNSEHETTAYTRAVITRAAQAGKLIALSTGRALSELRAHLDKLPGVGYIIGESGAWVYDIRNKKEVLHNALDDGDVDAIWAACADLDCISQAFIDNESMMQCVNVDAMDRYHIADFRTVFEVGSRFVDNLPARCLANRGRVEKINLYFSGLEDRERFMKHMAGRSLAVAESIGVGLELSPKGISKAIGLQALCDYLGIELSETMVVGDGDNDLDILAAAGLPVAMGNAIAEVMALAKAVTDDCDHDGAAKAIEAYMLDTD